MLHRVPPINGGTLPTLLDIQLLNPEAALETEPAHLIGDPLATLRDAGIGIVEIVLDGNCVEWPYLIQETPQSRIIGILSYLTALGGYPEHFLDNELVSIIRGDFDENWAQWIEYFGGQQG